MQFRPWVYYRCFRRGGPVSDAYYCWSLLDSASDHVFHFLSFCTHYSLVLRCMSPCVERFVDQFDGFNVCSVRVCDVGKDFAAVVSAIHSVQATCTTYIFDPSFSMQTVDSERAMLRLATSHLHKLYVPPLSCSLIRKLLDLCPLLAVLKFSSACDPCGSDSLFVSNHALLVGLVPRSANKTIEYAALTSNGVAPEMAERLLRFRPLDDMQSVSDCLLRVVSGATPSMTSVY